jgi:MFS family permease
MRNSVTDAALEYPSAVVEPVVDLLSIKAESPSSRIAWWAVVARFLVHGLVVSTWVSRIPAVKGSLGLSDGALGMALLGTAIGSVTGIPLSGWLVTRAGSRRASTGTSAAFALVLVLPAWSGNLAQLFLALFAFGALAGADDVAMNSQAVAVERIDGEPSMSRFHAMFSLGGILGAGAGAVVARCGIAARPHLTVAAALILTFSLATAPFLMETRQPLPPAHARFRMRDLSRPLLALSLIGFCIFLSEGAIADWTAVYLKQVLRAGAGMASSGYAVFSAAMFSFRLAGDRIAVRLGRAWTIRGGALLAASGLAMALLAPHPLWAMPGLAMVGAGYSSIIPLVFAAGGRLNPASEGAGVAIVSGLGYLGFLAGPPVIGFVSQLASLRIGLCVVVALSVLAAALVSVVGSTLNKPRKLVFYCDGLKR